MPRVQKVTLTPAQQQAYDAIVWDGVIDLEAASRFYTEVMGLIPNRRMNVIFNDAFAVGRRKCLATIVRENNGDLHHPSFYQEVPYLLFGPTIPESIFKQMDAVFDDLHGGGYSGGDAPLVVKSCKKIGASLTKDERSRLIFEYLDIGDNSVVGIAKDVR